MAHFLPFTPTPMNKSYAVLEFLILHQYDHASFFSRTLNTFLASMGCG